MRNKYHAPGLLLAFCQILLLSFGIRAEENPRFYQTWDWKSKFHGEKVMPRDSGWGADVLEGFESRFVDQGMAFDGPCRSTIIRLRGPERSKKGFLYIHGFNDYFFQSEMAREMVDSGYHFYAVDLRRYGRSRLPWQYPFNVRDMKEYFADIDSALVQMRHDGVSDITLGGHSTGGLTVCLFAACRGKDVGVERVVTDSPFLEWNFNPFMRDCAAPVIGMLGKIFPNAEVKQAHCDGYAYSLLKQYDGEWIYNTDWKMVYSPPVKFSWVGAINSAQSTVNKKRKDIAVPLLVMTSSRKIDGCNYTPEFKTGDAVLDPAMIRKVGEKLGSDRHICIVDSGIHDLILSPLPARRQAYDFMFSFMNSH